MYYIGDLVDAQEDKKNNGTTSSGIETSEEVQSFLCRNCWQATKQMPTTGLSLAIPFLSGPCEALNLFYLVTCAISFESLSLLPSYTAARIN